MSSYAQQLKTKLEKARRLRDQSREALGNVRHLLSKADSRGAAEQTRRWDRIIDNLERTLVRIKSEITGYEQQVKELESRLEKLSQPGEPRIEKIVPRDGGKPIEVKVTRDMNAVERLLAMPLSQLSALTLDEVSDLHEQLMGGPEPALDLPEEKQPAKGAKRDTALSARIEHAKKVRSSLHSVRKEKQESFMERRMQVVLRLGVDKLMKGKREQLHSEELEAMIKYHGRIGEQDKLSAADHRIKDILDAAIGDLKARAAQLRIKAMR